MARQAAPMKNNRTRYTQAYKDEALALADRIGVTVKIIGHHARQSFLCQFPVVIDIDWLTCAHGHNLDLTTSTAAAPKRMVELVADKLHISRATLHRRLAAQKTTYTDLLASVRRAEAARLLTETSMSVLDIGEILGFSDASSFNRFFREQFNQTPLKYRKSISG